MSHNFSLATHRSDGVRRAHAAHSGPCIDSMSTEARTVVCWGNGTASSFASPDASVANLRFVAMLQFRMVRVQMQRLSPPSLDPAA